MSAAGTLVPPSGLYSATLTMPPYSPGGPNGWHLIVDTVSVSRI